MGELSDMMRQLDAETRQVSAFERQNAERWAAAEYKSNERAGEFAMAAKRWGIPTMPLFARHVELKGRENPQPPRGYKFVARGWLVQAPNRDPDYMQPGIFLGEDLKTYESSGKLDRPPITITPPPEMPYVETTHPLIVGEEDRFPTVMQIPFADDKGLRVLADAIRRYQTTGDL